MSSSQIDHLNRPTESRSDRARPGFGELASDALRYWEPRRFLYNLALLAVVIVHFCIAWPESRVYLVPDTLFQFFLLAVMANISYCAAYAVDLFVQFSGQREAWAKWRWTVLATGIAFAAIIAHFVTSTILTGPHGG